MSVRVGFERAKPSERPSSPLRTYPLPRRTASATLHPDCSHRQASSLMTSFFTMCLDGIIISFPFHFSAFCTYLDRFSNPWTRCFPFVPVFRITCALGLILFRRAVHDTSLSSHRPLSPLLIVRVEVPLHLGFDHYVLRVLIPCRRLVRYRTLGICSISACTCI